jgi:hypothetical protein
VVSSFGQTDRVNRRTAAVVKKAPMFDSRQQEFITLLCTDDGKARLIE